MIIITPNPALDRTLLLHALSAGAVHRTHAPTLVTAGGKGLNAARAARTLGGDPLCMGFVGGHTGHYFADLAEAEGLRGSWTRINQETRTCIILVTDDGVPSVINETGPAVTAQHWAALETDALASARMQAAQVVGVCGSLPPGPPPESFAHLIEAFTARGINVWVDTSGAALATAWAAHPAGIKVNAAEAGQLLNGAVDTVEEATQAAQTLRAQNAHAHRAGQVIITLGAAGAVLATEAGTWYACPPVIQAVSNVGSGDAFVGAWLMALHQHQLAPEALRWGVAAGAANALSPGGGRFARSEFEMVLGVVRVEAL